MADGESPAGAEGIEGAEGAERFGRYDLVSLLGRGGMGEVWRAHDRHHDRDVALKRMTAAHAADPAFRERFLREARLTARLDSLHVIPLHDAGEIDGRLYLVMRLVDGPDLERTIAAAPEGMPPPRAVGIVEQVADALDSAHAAGLVHRDVKPSNVLVATSRGRDFCYLVDFGIAKAADDTSLTRTGTMLGTVAYMAPELFDDDRAGPRSDVYALGCVLFETLTGRRAVAGTDTPGLIHGHLYGPVPRTGRPDLGPFDAVLARALAKEPDERFASAGDLAAAAADALAPPVPAPPPTHPGHTGHTAHPGHTGHTAHPGHPGHPGPRSAAVGREDPPTGPVGEHPATRPGTRALPGRVGARRRRWPWVALAAALVVVVLGAVAVVVGARPGRTPGPGPSASPAPGGAVGAAPARPARIAARAVPGGLNHPRRLAIAPDGSRAWVAVAGPDQAPVQELDSVELPSGRVTATVPLTGRPDGVALAPDGRTVYVGLRTSAPADDVAVVDTASNQVTATVPVGQGPRGLELSGDGRLLYVADGGYSDVASNAVSVVDTATRTVVRTITVGPGPPDVGLTPDGRLAYVPSSGDAASAGATVPVVDTASGATVATVPVAPAPSGVAVSPDGRTVYVASLGDTVDPVGALTVVDVATQRVRTALRPSRTGLVDVAVSPDGSRVVGLATNADAVGTPGTVSVVDTATARVVDSVPVGPDADTVRFAPDGRHAYVTTAEGLWVVDVP